MRLLLVERENKVTKSLIDALKNNYVVDKARNGSRAISMCECNSYDAIIIDSNLSDIGSLELCGMIRGLNIDSPIALITEKYNCADRVLGFDAGVDVVIQKPLDFPEVVAQINAMTRRNGSNSNCGNVLKSGCISLDMKKKTFSVGEESVFLRRKEYDLLEYLIINRGRTVSKEELLEHIWEKGIYMFSNTVEVHVRSIRIKFHDQVGINVIKTHRGFGYEIES